MVHTLDLLASKPLDYNTHPPLAEDTHMQWLWILYPIITGVLLYFAVYELAKMDLFFTFLESGNIKYIYVGNTLKRIIADIEGKVIDKHIVRDRLSGDKDPRSWVERKLGLYWVGFPPFSMVKKFVVPLKKELEETSNKPPAEWIVDKGHRDVDSLRFMFPRPLMLLKAELGDPKDRQTVDVLAIGQFQVVNAYTPVVQLKGDFWELLAGIMRAAILDIVERQGTMDAFIVADKSDSPTSILYSLWAKGADSDFNKVLIERTGLMLVGAAIPQWDPSDEATRKAMQLAFVALKEKEKALIDASAYSESLKIKTDAEALAQRNLAAARGVRVRETATGIAGSLDNADHDTVAQAVATILQAEAHAGPDSKITTVVVNGGNTPAVIPLGGGK